MSRLPLFLVSVVILFGGVFAWAEEDAFKTVQNQIEKITQTPFTGTLDEYQPYAAKIGEEILALLDPLLTHSELSEENKAVLAQNKNLGLLLRFGFDDAEYAKHYEEFLEKSQDFKLNRQWIAKQFYDGQKVFFDDEQMPKTEKAEKFKQLIDRVAPQINKYFNDEKRISDEQTPSIIVSYSEMLDPDGSLGVVRSTIEKLRPIFEADAKRAKYDLLGSCARSALNSLQRLEMSGKPLEYVPIDLDNEPLNMEQFKGKTLLIVSVPSHPEKLGLLKKVYGSLKNSNFEIILVSDDDAGVAKERLKSNGETWFVVTRYEKPKKGEHRDCFEHWGTFTIGMVVDPKGIVSYVRSDDLSPEICEKLAPIFPEQEKQITEIANEIRTIDEEKRRTSRAELANLSPELDENIPLKERQLLAFYWKIVAYAPPEMEIKLIDVILSSNDLPQYARSTFWGRKAMALAEIARQNVVKYPEKRPELLYREVEEFADSLLPKADHSMRHGLLYPKHTVLYHMREYLKKMDSVKEQKEYAAEITRRFVEINKLAPESFYHNSRGFVMSFRDTLEDIDAEHGTHLQQSFLEQIIPVFAASESLEYQQEAKKLEKALHGITLIGKEMEFEMIALDGSKVNVKDFLGKVVLVNFWATWCGPCIREFPNMKTQYEKYKPQGFEMLAYSIDQEYEDILAFQEKNQYPWINGSWLKSKAAGMRDYHSDYGIRGVPATFLLGRNGKVVFRLAGSDDEALNKELEKIFALQ